MLDLEGQIFGELTVLGIPAFEEERYCNINSKWVCQCSCGNTSIIQSCHLRSGSSKSCGQCHSYNINHWFFNNIKQEQLVYLGGIFADGSIKDHSVEIRQKNSNSIMLEPFVKWLNYGELRCINGNFDKRTNNYSQPAYIMNYTSSRLANILRTFGIIENKTKNTTSFSFLDKLTLEQLDYWIFGFWAFDGCISTINQLTLSFDISQTKIFTDYFNERYNVMDFTFSTGYCPVRINGKTRKYFLSKFLSIAEELDFTLSEIKITRLKEYNGRR